VSCPPKLDGDELIDPQEDPLPAELLQLYDLHAPQLLRFALLTQAVESAQEAVQQAFLSLLRERRGGRVPAPLDSWLLRQVRDLVLVSPRPGSGPMPRVPNPMERFGLATETLRFAWPLLADLLSPREYEILLMRTAGYSYSQIAVALEISTGTVGSMLTRALRKIAATQPPGE
jgi:DNA-directed RNA polymerase specialized sigma24 family protein